MSDRLSVQELMKAFGFVFGGSCHCDGYDTWKYKKETIQVKWRRAQQRFQIVNSRTTVLNWTKIVQLQESLKKLFPDVAIQEQKA